MVWPVLSWVVLSGICFWLDKLDPAMEKVPTPHLREPGRHYFPGEPYELRPIPGNPLEWAPEAWVFIALAILYAVGCWIIYQHTKRYRGNAVRWATASVVFSPILVGIAYGLTWPKNRQD